MGRLFLSPHFDNKKIRNYSEKGENMISLFLEFQETRLQRKGGEEGEKKKKKRKTKKMEGRRGRK